MSKPPTRPSAEIFSSRLPLKTDLVTCRCAPGLENSDMLVAIAEPKKACPACQSLAIIKCRRCGKHYCLGCILVVAASRRAELGVETLSETGPTVN